MAIQAVWDNDEKTIVRHIYIGSWTVEEYFALINQHKTMLSSVEHQVDIINDVRAAGPIPSGFMPALKYANISTPHNEGLKLMVGSENYVRSLLSVITRLSSHAADDLVFAPSIDEAYRMITRSRERLPA